MDIKAQTSLVCESKHKFAPLVENLWVQVLHPSTLSSSRFCLIIIHVLKECIAQGANEFLL